MNQKAPPAPRLCGADGASLDKLALTRPARSHAGADQRFWQPLACLGRPSASFAASLAKPGDARSQQNYGWRQDSPKRRGAAARPGDRQQARWRRVRRRRRRGCASRRRDSATRRGTAGCRGYSRRAIARRSLPACGSDGPLAAATCRGLFPRDCSGRGGSRGRLPARARRLAPGWSLSPCGCSGRSGSRRRPSTCAGRLAPGWSLSPCGCSGRSGNGRRLRLRRALSGGGLGRYGRLPAGRRRYALPRRRLGCGRGGHRLNRRRSVGRLGCGGGSRRLSRRRSVGRRLWRRNRGGQRRRLGLGNPAGRGGGCQRQAHYCPCQEDRQRDEDQPLFLFDFLVGQVWIKHGYPRCAQSRAWLTQASMLTRCQFLISSMRRSWSGSAAANCLKELHPASRSFH
jgi:hypothetical protein